MQARETPAAAPATGDAIRRVLIVGGGTAGWMAAAGLSFVFGQKIRIDLVESDAIGIIGVGEATLPNIRNFLNTIGISEAELFRHTNATFKLGIRFVDWARRGDSYIHPFGAYGAPIRGIRFHQCWRRIADDPETGDFDVYSLPIQMAKAGRFARPLADPRKVGSTFGYAYQFDAAALAPLLRRHAEARGVVRHEGVITDVIRDGTSGDITAVRLGDGRELAGDFFIDCSGLRALLIEGALKTGFVDWSHWLPCNRALAAPCGNRGEPTPYTTATARTAGWEWRIPLQHRVGNGYVYVSQLIEDAAVHDALVSSLDKPPQAEPRLLRFQTGRRRLSWNHNCVAIGLAGGFLEPLESTSIYLVQQAITLLAELFPRTRNAPVEQRTFNDRMNEEFERTRDFLILHYHATERDDAELWRYVRSMPIPDTLRDRMEVYRRRGRADGPTRGVFEEASWLAVLQGQRVAQDGYDQRADTIDPAHLRHEMAAMRTQISNAVASLPTHAQAIRDTLGGT